MYEKLNCPVSESHILISKRKCILGSALPLSPTISGWGARCLWVEDLSSGKEGGMAHGLGRYATDIYCINSILSHHSLGHFIHIAGLTETKYFWKGMEEPCVYSNPKIYFCTHIDRSVQHPSLTPFPRVKPYPTNDLISNTAK